MVEHGTVTCYHNGCRRPECRDAWRVYHLNYRRRKRGEAPIAPSVFVASAAPEPPPARGAPAGRCVVCLGPLDRGLAASTLAVAVHLERNELSGPPLEDVCSGSCLLEVAWGGAAVLERVVGEVFVDTEGDTRGASAYSAQIGQVAGPLTVEMLEAARDQPMRPTTYEVHPNAYEAFARRVIGNAAAARDLRGDPEHVISRTGQGCWYDEAVQKWRCVVGCPVNG